MCARARESFLFSIQGCYLLEILHIFLKKKKKISRVGGKNPLMIKKERGNHMQD